LIITGEQVKKAAAQRNGKKILESRSGHLLASRTQTINNA